MFKMGGLKDKMPVIFWTFLFGSAALAAVPLVTAGFYSKDMILWYAYSSKNGGTILWLAGLIGAFITGLYTFRMVFVTFWGETKGHIDKTPGSRIKIPLIILGVLSLIGGFIEMPHTLGHFAPLSEFMHSVLPEVDAFELGLGTEALFQLIAAAAGLSGIFLAWNYYLKKQIHTREINRSAAGRRLNAFLMSGCGFDWLYDKVIIQPVLWIARINKQDIVDMIYKGIATFSQGMYRLLRLSQDGRVRLYAVGIAFGAILTIAIAVFL